MRGLRPGLQILDGCPLEPLRHRLGIDPQLPAQRRERSLRSLYCCSDDVRWSLRQAQDRRGAPVTYLSHTASFHSDERIAPSNRGIKHLGYQRRKKSGSDQSQIYNQPLVGRMHTGPGNHGRRMRQLQISKPSLCWRNALPYAKPA